MDPSAPKDNSNTPKAQNQSQGPASPPLGQDSDASSPNAWSPIEQPQSGGPQPALTPDGAGPILPGQFVITGEDSILQPQKNQAPIPASPSSATPNNMAPAGPADMPNVPENQNSSNFLSPDTTAQDQLITPPNPSTPNLDPPQAPQSPPVSASQPDPTPFMPPTPGPTVGGFSKAPGGGIKKLRTIVIFLGIIILLMILGAIAWFFFFANQASQAVKTENQTQAEPPIQQQSIPKRGEGGFDQIQEGSPTSNPLQESTPAAPTAPNP